MLVWGFDLGTTSVGFAAIEYDEDRRMVGSIKALGSRIFPEGITEKEREPRNKERRSKRMMRRQLRRKRWRRRAMHEALAEAGLLPSPNPKEWPAELTAALPYELRDRGLTEKLEPWEVGRALFHALKRRGFKSARLVDDKKPSKDEEKEEEGIKQQIADLDAKRGDKTVGAYIGQPIRAWRANPKGPAPKIRGQYTARAMAEEEFDRLWDAQAKHHPALMTPERKQLLRDTAFRQRPIFWRLKTLGTCSLEPGEPLAAKGSWLGQQFEMLQTLNNLKIATGNGRALDDNERAVLRQALAEQRRLTFGDARKLLKALWQENGTPFKGTKFNFEVEGGRKELHGNAMEAALRKGFGAAWSEHPQKQAIRDEAFERLWSVNYRRLGNKRVEIRTEQDVAAERQKLIAHAMQHWGMARKAAEDFADTDMPAAWLHVSEKAIRTLLPALEAGETYGAARPRLYPNVAPTEAEKRKRKRKPKSSRILGLPTDPLDLPIQRNPTVQRALTELRKVFNNLLEANGYRLPDLIRIELAREVALSSKDKKKLLQSIRDNTNERKAAEKALRERGVEPTGGAILKWRLWQECDKICPYTQETIGWEDLFGPKPKFDIEHITPRSRSQDDSFANKTLGHVAFNRNFKRNSTLVEAFKRNHGKPLQPDWPDLEQISSRLNRLAAEKKFPRGKVKRLLNAESPEERLNRLDKFDPTERDLEDDTGNSRLIRDTAYIARTASLWLATMMPQGGDGGRSKVQTRNGRAVAHLRQLWRLNHLLGPDGKKNREDHRHHALDAALVACFDVRAMQQIVGWFQQLELEPDKPFPDIQMPWRDFVEDLRQALDKIVISHRVRRKVSGALHDETRLGSTDEPPLSEAGKTYRFYVKRKELASMSKGEIAAIRDDKIRALAEDRLAQFDGDAKKAFAEPLMLDDKTSTDPKGKRPIRKARFLVKLQAEMVVPAGHGNNAVAERGDVHHYVLYRLPDGKADHETVSRFEAMQRLSRKQPVINRKRDDGASFVMTLAPGDMLRRRNDKGEWEYLVVRKFNAAGQVFIKPHNQAGAPKPEISFGREKLASGEIEKISVDPIGRIRPARD